MKTNEKILKEIQTLPHQMQEEVMDFIESLRKRQEMKRKGKPTFVWAGSLKDLRNQFTSVELQHKISDFDRTEQGRKTPADILKISN